jgi:hypothetical protein
MQLGAELDQLRDYGRDQRHAPFVRLCFLENGNVNVHVAIQCFAAAWIGLPA